MQWGGHTYCTHTHTLAMQYAYLLFTVDVWCLAAVPHLQGSWPTSSWCCWPLTCLRAQSPRRWSSPFWFSLALLQWCALPESSYLPVLGQTKMTEGRTHLVNVYHFIQLSDYLVYCTWSRHAGLIVWWEWFCWKLKFLIQLFICWRSR